MRQHELRASHYKLQEIANTYRLGNILDNAQRQYILDVMIERIVLLEGACSANRLDTLEGARYAIKVLLQLGDTLHELEEFGYCGDGRYNALVQMECQIDSLESYLENIRDVIIEQVRESKKEVRIQA